jgi:hypothetical protein
LKLSALAESLWPKSKDKKNSKRVISVKISPSILQGAKDTTWRKENEEKKEEATVHCMQSKRFISPSFK